MDPAGQQPRLDLRGLFERWHQAGGCSERRTDLLLYGQRSDLDPARTEPLLDGGRLLLTGRQALRRSKRLSIRRAVLGVFGRAIRLARVLRYTSIHRQWRL